MAQMDIERGLRVLNARALAAQILIGLYVVCVVAFDAGALGMLATGTTFADMDRVVPSLTALSKLAIMVCFVLSALAMCLWIYRAHANLRQLPAPTLEFPPPRPWAGTSCLS